MYLSAIVIFGKEISPWWIAGGVGTGVVVAGVIIYMRNHKDDDPNFKAPKIKDIKKFHKRPVKEEVIAEPEVPIIKESTIVPVISEQIAPQGVIAEQVVSKLTTLKTNKRCFEEKKLNEEQNLDQMKKDISQNEIEWNEINTRFRTRTDKNFKIERANCLKKKEDLIKAKINLESRINNLNRSIEQINTNIEKMEKISLVSNMLVYVPIICLNIYQIYQAINAIMVISVVAKGVTNMCMFKIFLICLKAIIIGSPIWILVGTIVYKIIKYMSS